MLSAFFIKATGLHSCIVNWSIFDKIRVKIAKSDLPFLLQLYNNTTPIIEEPNIDTSGVVIEAHDISLLDQGHSHPQLHSKHGPFCENSSKNSKIGLAIFTTAL